ncbi:hypothetical protein PG990_006652 [Apiospora arundinis]|uniref:Uncharacterized protein n=1 Tax=Apiospora arundinis TaxID=335852 RepID=A0ABR2JBG0_9PEZI
MAVAVRTLRILHFWVPGCTSVRALPYMQLWCNGKTLDVMHDSSHLSWEHPAVTAYIAYMNALRPTREVYHVCEYTWCLSSVDRYLHRFAAYTPFKSRVESRLVSGGCLVCGDKMGSPVMSTYFHHARRARFLANQRPGPSPSPGPSGNALQLQPSLPTTVVLYVLSTLAGLIYSRACYVPPAFYWLVHEDAIPRWGACVSSSCRQQMDTEIGQS